MSLNGSIKVCDLVLIHLLVLHNISHQEILIAGFSLDADCLVDQFHTLRNFGELVGIQVRLRVKGFALLEEHVTDCLFIINCDSSA